MVNCAFNECAHPERSESGEPETMRPAVSQIGNRVLLAVRTAGFILSSTGLRPSAFSMM